MQQVDWTNLAFQPYFTLTAANVLYVGEFFLLFCVLTSLFVFFFQGYWSHDIVGPPGLPRDYELHTRWIQWGTLSGVFRTHDRGMSGGACANNHPDSCAIVEVFRAPVRFANANRHALQQRARLLPYLYASAREAFDTGVGLIRPMYYESPQCNEAYQAAPDGAFPQYYFGPDFIVSPVVTKSGSNGLSTKKIWLPTGRWYDVVAGQLVDSTNACGTTIDREYDVSEMPVSNGVCGDVCFF